MRPILDVAREKLAITPEQFEPVWALQGEAVA